MKVEAFAPGRVNVIGDHTDYTGGLVLPMAIGMGTTVAGTRGGPVVELRSDREELAAVVPLDVVDPASIEPAWARYVAGVVAEMRPADGFQGRVTTTLPIGAGLSSSAALEVAVALALGYEGDERSLAEMAQRAEQRASGVPCGIMDQLASAAGIEGSLLRIDCRSLEVTTVELPAGTEIVGVDSGQERTLAGSAYGVRRTECETAERFIGPLRDAGPGDIESLTGTLRLRARHVITENQRVDDFIAALGAGDLAAAGSLMAASHASLRDDFEVTTPALDDLVERLLGSPGVHGARMTGGGFGGVVVALADVASPAAETFGGWRFRPGGGARVKTHGGAP